MRPLPAPLVIPEHGQRARDPSNSPSYRLMSRALNTILTIQYRPLSLADQYKPEGPLHNTLRIHITHISTIDPSPPLHRIHPAPATPRRHRHMPKSSNKHNLNGSTRQRQRLPPNIMLPPPPLTHCLSPFLVSSNGPAANVRHRKHSVLNPPNRPAPIQTNVSSTSTSTSSILTLYTLTRRESPFSSVIPVIIRSSTPEEEPEQEGSEGFTRSMKLSRRDRALPSRSISRG